VNYPVSPVAIQKLYSNVGPNYVEVLIPPRVSNFIKEEIVLFNATDVLPNREAIRVAVRDKLKSELDPYSITVNDLLIDNIHFDDDFTKAIEQKQVATQNAQAEQNKVQIADAQAKQVAATAQGASDKLRIEAEGQADANRTISASLTPELIQFQAVQKLAPNIQIALIPSGQGIILDPATLLKPPATPAAPPR
jgi:prohibitin 2